MTVLANGYERAFAERCFQQIEGFGAGSSAIARASATRRAMPPEISLGIKFRAPRKPTALSFKHCAGDCVHGRGMVIRMERIRRYASEDSGLLAG